LVLNPLLGLIGGYIRLWEKKQKNGNHQITK
jgi:hypothetical protein